MLRRKVGRAPLVTVAVVVALALAGGGVVAYDSAHRPVIHTAALDMHPGSLTVDPASGHAFVETYNVDPQSHEIQAGSHLSMLDIRTGVLSPTIDLGVNIEATAVDARRGRLVVVGEDSQVRLIDTHSGRIITTMAAGAINNGIAVDERRDRIYVTHGEGSLTYPGLDILDARTGALLRQMTPMNDELALSGDSLQVDEPVADEQDGHVFLPYTLSSPVIPGRATVMTDTVATLDDNGHLLHTTALDHFSGQGGYSSFNLLVDAPHSRAIVIDGNTGDIVIFDARTGHVMRRLRLSKVVAPSPRAWTNPFGPWGLDERTGRLFVATGRQAVCTFPSNSHTLTCVPTGPSGRLYMIDTRTGRLVRRLLPGVDPGVFTVDARAGCVLVGSSAPAGTGKGATLFILDATSGATLHRLSLAQGGNPVIDDQTGRVYISDGRGSITALDARAGRLSQTLDVGNSVDGNAAPGTQTYTSVAVYNGRVVMVRDNGYAAASPDPLGWAPGWLRQRLPWRPPRPRAVPGTVSAFAAP